MSGARPDTWMPLYWGDYWKDTGHLSLMEHGAYLNLLGACWVRAGCLTMDDTSLARLAKATAGEWSKVRPAVMAFFHVVGGCYRHKRIDAEIERCERISKRRSEAGATGAANKWQAHGKRMANAMTNAKQNDANHSHSHRREEPPSPIGLAPPLKPDAKGTRLEADWQPSPDDCAFADQLNLDIRAVAARFRDYWIAKPGADGRKADWPATWRNWCRKEADGGPGNRGRGQVQRAPASLAGATAAAIDALARKEQRTGQGERTSAGDWPLPSPYGEQGARSNGYGHVDRGAGGRASGVSAGRSSHGAAEMAQVIEVVADAGRDPGRVPVASGAQAGNAEPGEEVG